MILVTGGAGFIGANFILDWLRVSDEPVLNLDKLTYAGNCESLAELAGDPRYAFVQGDIADQALIESLLTKHAPRAVVNLAAESHVDRSIHGPGEFIQTNIVGTFKLLDSVRAYYAGLRDALRGRAPTPVPPREALAVMALMDCAMRSAAEGRPLRFGRD